MAPVGGADEIAFLEKGEASSGSRTERCGAPMHALREGPAQAPALEVLAVVAPSRRSVTQLGVCWLSGAEVLAVGSA